MDDVAHTTTYPCPTDTLDFNPAPQTAQTAQTTQAAVEPQIPAYLQETYHWCYLHPRHVRWLDREIVVRTILWQQHNRLQRLAFSEIEPGQSVLQPASVYGRFVPNLATHIGPEGQLDVVDVAEVQVQSATRKLQDHPHARVHHSNILDFRGGPYDVVCCYFLLHEIPRNYKFRVVNQLLDKVEPGGKVVFVDYHKPYWWHPLKLITSIVFDTLEPFAKDLWWNPIKDFAAEHERFEWRTQTIFGKLFQKTVATRLR